MKKKGLCVLTVVNLLLQFVYLAFGRFTSSELGILEYVFFVFRPEFLLLSGLVALVVVCVILILLWKGKKEDRRLYLLLGLLNLEHIFYWCWLMTQQ